LTFDEDYSRFDGIDFNSLRPIEGERQKLGLLQQRILTAEGLRTFLINTTWSWHRPYGPEEELQFFEDGTARHTSFIAKFQVKSSREVELRIGKARAKLTFDEDCSRFDGMDFNSRGPIRGKRK
jgi:hypothetical protein